MRVLVTGATGFIGHRLVQRLSTEGHEIRILTRSPEKARAKIHEPHAAFKWEPEREPAPASALEGADVVVHLAGEGVAARRWSEDQKRRIRDSRVLGTRNLVQTMNYLGRSFSPVFVCASAIGIYGERGDEVLTEHSPRGTGFLSDVVAEWEHEAFAVQGVRASVIRIGMVLGEEGGALEKLLPLFRAGAGGPLGDGRQWIPWIHVDDLVSLFTSVITHPSWKGVFNGVGPSPVRNSEFSHTLAAALHRPAFLRAPAFALRLAMGEMAQLVLTSERVVPERALEAGFTFRYPTLREALESLIAGEKAA